MSRLGCTLLMTVVLAAPSWVLAGGGGGGEHAESPPLLSFDPGSAVWAIVVFVGLLAILRLAAWGPILKGLQGRERFIHDSIEAAKRERLEAEKLLAHYQEQLEKARLDATAIVEEGRRDAEALKRTIEASAKSESDATVTRAKRDIGIARDTALKEIYQLSAELGAQIASRIVEKELSAKDHERLISESIDELSRMKGHSRN